MLTINDVAGICHEANRAYCETLGDFSQPRWADAPPDIVASAVDGVTAILDRRVKRPQDSHDNWMRLKLHQGWRWGEKKDTAAKTHPDLLPYQDLPEAEKLKDGLFFDIVTGLLPRGRQSIQPATTEFPGTPSGPGHGHGPPE